jgi:two-component system sensor histidine kinase AlgZ
VDTHGHRPLDALFRPPVVIAVILAGEALALVLALAPSQKGDRLVLFGLASLGIQWIALASLCALLLLRKALARMPARWVAWACLGILLGMTLLVTSVALELVGMSVELEEGGASFVLRMLAIALVVGLLALLAFQNYSEATRLAVRAKQLELESLRARVRPHFLFNTLNSGIALVRQRPEQAEELLLGLSELFRVALARPHDVPLEEEIALVRRYLQIEAVRFGPRLRVAWRLPEPLPEIAVPALAVQALVENAVRHGIERLPDGGEVGIEVATEGDAVMVAVRNPVPAGEDGGNGGHSIGLQATRARLQASTGGRGSLESGREGGEFVARMRVPGG